MKKIEVLVVIGTRPELIKMAPVIHAIKKSTQFNVRLCLTGQHKEMLDQVIQDFDIEVDFNLSVMSHDQSLSDVTSKILIGISALLKEHSFKLVIVHGDTTTAMAASLASFYCGVKICHVEAGLRTQDIFRPFPEEFNRKLIALYAGINFSPTKSAFENLIKEGVDKRKIFITGNTVIDSLFYILNKIVSNPALLREVQDSLVQLLSFDITHSKYVLITAHRRENFGEGFISIFEAIRELAKRFPSAYFVYPVHLNPNIRNIVFKMLGAIDNVKLIEPQSYLHFSFLLKNCYFVLTDSGGIQEEAPGLGKPVLVMRSETERPEAIIAGTVKLVSSDKSQIVESASNLFQNDSLYKKMSMSVNPYGDGTASIQICKILENIYAQKR